MSSKFDIEFQGICKLKNKKRPNFGRFAMQLNKAAQTQPQANQTVSILNTSPTTIRNLS